MFDWLKRDKVTKKWLWTSLAAFVVMIIVNGLAGSTTLIGGVQTGDISDIYENLFTPAGFTFSIWSLIYLLLAGFLLRAFGVIDTKKPHLKAEAMDRVLVLFTATSIFNVAWLLAWQYEVLWLSVLIMLGLLVKLAGIVKILHEQKMSLGEYALLRIPFSVYLGWISVATIANISAWLVSIEWDGFGISQSAWTVAVLVIAALIAVVKGVAKCDPLFVLVFVWAFVGILHQHMSVGGFDGEYSQVIVTLVILLPVLIMTTVQLIREHEQTVALMKLFK